MIKVVQKKQSNYRRFFLEWKIIIEYTLQMSQKTDDFNQQAQVFLAKVMTKSCCDT